MAPNEALFDSINRGDITAAREALGRGADLNAHNVLGMTPLDLSIDLGRNDISFLLLSMRGEIRRGSPPGDAAAILSGSRTGGRKTAPVKVATAPAGEANRAPRLFANDGGVPVPSAGFLGFDAGSRAR